MKLREVIRRDQLRWGDIGFGPISGEWPAVSFARGTSAWSQLNKINPDNDAIISVCVGNYKPAFSGRVTGVQTVENFTAPTSRLIEPETYKRSQEDFGGDRWPDSIPVRQAWAFTDPPLLLEVTENPRGITTTRGRYLASLDEQIYSRLADLDVEPIELYRSPDYMLLAAQPRRVARRQAGYAPSVPADLQGVIDEKVKAIFAAARRDGRLVCQYEQPERRVSMSELDLSRIVWDLWLMQGGRCTYCRIRLENHGLAQISIDRIDNSNREYGQHNVQLTCWECNRGKGSATDEEMRSLWTKRWLALKEGL